jgi:Polysaccharide lyase
MALHSKINSLISLTLLFAIPSCKSPVNACDDFEASELSKIWSTDRMASNALELQSKIVRNESGAAKITLRTGDVFEAGIGKSENSERDELRENKKLESVEDKTYEYSFSLFLPDSFPIVPVRLVIAQWKQHCSDNPDCSDDSPVLALRYVSGKFSIVMQTDTGKTTLYETHDEIRNKWLDFKFVIHFSRLSNGST